MCNKADDPIVAIDVLKNMLKSESSRADNAEIRVKLEQNTTQILRKKIEMLEKLRNTK